MTNRIRALALAAAIMAQSLRANAGQVCFFDTGSLQCHEVHFAQWPAMGTGAQLCSDTGDGFRCQGVSRADGVELLRHWQCTKAQGDVKFLPGEAQWREIDAKNKIKFAKQSLRSAELNAKQWDKYEPRRLIFEGPNAGGDDAAYKHSMFLKSAQSRLVQEARDKLARAIKESEDSRQADAPAMTDAQARLTKWCRSDVGTSYAEPIIKSSIPQPTAIEDRNPQDFPLASCKSWNGTVTKRSGVDTGNASMNGIVTRANVEEYCNRIVPDDRPARDTVVAECLQSTLPAATSAVLSARANCKKDTLEFSDGTNAKRVRFPVVDTSCGSNNPPLIAQFRKLCPKRAAELLVE